MTKTTRKPLSEFSKWARRRQTVTHSQASKQMISFDYLLAQTITEHILDEYATSGISLNAKGTSMLANAYCIEEIEGNLTAKVDKDYYKHMKDSLASTESFNALYGEGH